MSDCVIPPGASGDSATPSDSADVRQKFILVADVGTTTIRCHIYNKAAQVVAQAEEQSKLIYPAADAVEMECDELWGKFKHVIDKALKSGGLHASDMACMGITTFRNSFVTWDRMTGEPFHNINMWQDTRTKDVVKDWNKSFTLATLKKGSGFLHTITGSQRFKAGNALKFLTQAVPLRLKWMIDNVPKLKQRLDEKQVMFGTIDTWLLWKLTAGKVWITDRASASSTLLYDTFQNMWSTMLLGLVGIPAHLLPQIIDTSGNLGTCDSAIFGSEIPITGLIADQQAALFGHCCFLPGDMKLTMGTGSFLNVNIGDKPLASITEDKFKERKTPDKMKPEIDSMSLIRRQEIDSGGLIGGDAVTLPESGIYPLVAWDIDREITFTAEASFNSVGTCIDWLKSTGIIADVSSSSQIAKSVPDTNGCYFVPAFSGLQAPINDDRAGGLLIGITPSVTAAHITRAVLESIAFVIKLQYETMLAECGQKVSYIRVDGGVSNNDFILQCLADILHKPIHRPRTVNMTSRGAAFLAGIGANIWTSLDELKSLAPEETIFLPQDNWLFYRNVIVEWERAVRRSKGWTHDS